jgi:hypothetical protein
MDPLKRFNSKNRVTDIGKQQEVSLAHLVREVDVQSSHPSSSPHRHRFGFYCLKNHFPYCIPFKNIGKNSKDSNPLKNWQTIF